AMILSLLVVTRVVSAATCLQREAHFSRARYVIRVKQITGLLPSGLRWAAVSANIPNNTDLPLMASPSAIVLISAQPCLCCGSGRPLARCRLRTSSTTSSVVRTHGAIVYTAPTKAICFLLAFSPFFRRRWTEGGAFSGRCIGTPLPSAVTTSTSPSSSGGGAG